MCVSFANGIQAWTCQQDAARRDAMLAIWAGAFAENPSVDAPGTEPGKIPAEEAGEAAERKVAVRARATEFS